MVETRVTKKVMYLGLILSVIALTSLAGCSIVRQPSPEEYESVRQNKKAIVLFRLTGSLDSKEVHVLLDTVGGYPNYILLSFGLANLDAGEPLRVFFVNETVPSWLPSYMYFSPSHEIAESGWGAFLLEPGTYYLRITSIPKGVIEPIPEFRFMVPPNAPLVYIGSLHVACTTIENAGLYWGRGFGFGSCSLDTTAANEEGAAKVIGETSFRDFGSLSAMIMQRYDLAPLPPGTISKVAPVGLLVPRGKIDVGSPEWMRRAMSLGLAPTAGLLALGFGLGPQGAALGVIGGVLWAPVGTVLGYLGGKWSESSWEPCRQALQKALIKFDPMAALAAKLKAALDNWNVPALDIAEDRGAGADTTDVKSILHAQIQRVVLRLCPSSFLSTPLCLDVATHASLFDVATQTYVYDRMFVYSDADPSSLEFQPYELSVPSSTTAATGRALEAYCEEGGGEILQADLSNALDATVNQIVRDLGLRVEDGEPDR
jgi:hypothetical protein